jgi:predicted dehydrogenase
MNKTRIAIAGAGYIGQAHMAVAQKSPTCMLSAVIDPSPAAEAIAAKAGVPMARSSAATRCHWSPHATAWPIFALRRPSRRPPGPGKRSI